MRPTRDVAKGLRRSGEGGGEALSITGPSRESWLGREQLEWGGELGLVPILSWREKTVR